MSWNFHIMFYLKLFLSSLVTYKEIIKKFPLSLCSEQKGLVTHLLAAILLFGGGRGWYKKLPITANINYLTPYPQIILTLKLILLWNSPQTTGDNERNCWVQEIFIGWSIMEIWQKQIFYFLVWNVKCPDE